MIPGTAFSAVFSAVPQLRSLGRFAGGLRNSVCVTRVETIHAYRNNLCILWVLHVTSIDQNEKGIQTREEKKEGDRPRIIQKAMYAFTRIYSDEWKAGWKHTSRFCHCTHVPCILSLFASSGGLCRGEHPMRFRCAIWENVTELPDAIELTAPIRRTATRAWNIETRKRFHHMARYRVLDWPTATWRYTNPRSISAFYFFAFYLRFGQTSMFLSIVFIAIFLRIAGSTRTRDGDIIKLFKVS